MKIGGLIKFTLIDYPGHVAAVVFTQGCNFRCRYCHNPELVYPHLLQESMPKDDVLSFLRKRKGTLEGVVITGGEPTLHLGLIDFMAEIKALGYKIKLDTNGTKPEVLQEAIERQLVDFVAMDLKAPLEKYSLITGVEFDPKIIQKSMDMIVASGLPYEFRTTYDKEVLTDEDIQAISDSVQGKNYRVQECLPVAKEKAALKVMHDEV
ncbi:MAG: anaerobic ribonucleoside-triphosphate reductase activating protein [Elusimicrobiaceae bacterium]|nr:anaerobic ribonucleoside-triphosphate reductase activating protein [Elusimicrobiaceae bacterium]MBR5609066.1 anaerobic ribonucleoside-triphosphate reductase activating protein [Elusimicrobiaceae bacterium]